LALKNKMALHVCFCLLPKFLDATIRHFKFMLDGLHPLIKLMCFKCQLNMCFGTGLQEVQEECSQLEIQFHMLEGEAAKVLPSFVKAHNIGALVVDFSPLRTHTKWLEDLKTKIPKDVPLCQVHTEDLFTEKCGMKNLQAIHSNLWCCFSMF